MIIFYVLLGVSNCYLQMLIKYIELPCYNIILIIIHEIAIKNYHLIKLIFTIIFCPDLYGLYEY